MTGSMIGHHASVSAASAAAVAQQNNSSNNSSAQQQSLPSEAQMLQELFSKPEPVDLSQYAKFSGFFKKSQDERRSLIAKSSSSSPSFSSNQTFESSLSSASADFMIENCVGICSLPLGVVPVFVLNSKHFVVPMAVEEPSVVAAASSACKLVAENGGFKACSTENVMIGQIQVVDFSDMAAVADAMQAIYERKNELIEFANSYCQSMVARGGGVVDVNVRTLPGKKWMVVHLHINVCEAMGANIVNTVVEGAAPWISEVTGGRVGLKILSNLCVGRRTKVCFRIPLQQMAWKGVKGRAVAERIMEAWEFAELDPFRATTNNKGIMNGIDAVAIATGQDWRAIEAAAHAYASHTGRYTSLTKYYIDNEHECFVGSMEIPISVGTKGGALSSHPTYKLAHDMLGFPDAKELSQIIVSIGLAQNFAAIRALAIEGIQKGHMALHARNIAISAGAPENLVPRVVAYMHQKKNISKACAEEYLLSLQNIQPVLKQHLESLSTRL